MANTERYTTVIELNSEQAKHQLDELKKKVESWRQLKDEAIKAKEGKSFISQINRELKAAEKELKKYDNEVARTIDTLSNLGTASVKRIEDAQKHLKRMASEVPHDGTLYQQLNEQLDLVTQELENIRATKAFEQLQLEAEGATKSAEQLKAELAFIKQTADNAETASVKQLQLAERTAQNIKNSAQKGSDEWNQASAGLEMVRTRLSAIEEEERKVVKTIDRYNEELKKAGKEEKIVADEMELVNQTIDKLSSASIRDIEYSIRILNEQLRDTERSGDSVDELTKKLKLLNTELKKVQEMQNPDKKKGNFFSRSVTFLNTNWGAITQMLGAYSGVRDVVKGSVEAFAEMDQEMNNVRKYTGQTIEEVKDMNEDFKRMDTRTPREQLNQLAGSAGRLGLQGKEAIMDFVYAADQINLALGDDLGQGAVDKIGKLAMAFGEDDRMGLRNAMLSTGSAVNELSQNSAANAGYLVDFAARLSGVGVQAGLTQAQILGLGAAMDENMQRDEMAATALSQIITKMTTDSETFARIAGKNVEEFAQLVKTDMNAALMQFFEAMNKKGGFAELAPLFEQMGLDGTRAIGVLSTLASKIGDVQRHQQLATKAYREHKSVEAEAAIQNSTYQAKLEKTRKAFNELRIELGEKLLPVATAFISGTGLLVKGLGVVADFFIKHHKLILTLTAAIAGYTLAVKAHTIAEKTSAAATWLSEKAQKALNAAQKASPVGLLVGAVSALAAGLALFRRNADAATRSQEAMNRAEEEAASLFAQEKTRVDNLTRAVHDNTLSVEARRKALEELKTIVHEYNAEIDEEGRLTRDNTQAIDDYLKKRREQMLLNAFEKEMEKANEKIAQVTSAMARLEEERKNGKWGGSIGRIAAEGLETELQNAQQVLDAVEKAYTETLHRMDAALGQTGGQAPDSTDDGNSSADTRAFWEEELKKQKANLKALREDANSTAAAIEEAEKKVKEAQGKVDLFTGQKQLTKEQQQLEQAEKERLRKADDAAKAETERQMAELTQRYAMGRILYCDYVDEQERLQLEGIERRMLIYGTETKEYQKLAHQREELLLNGSKESRKLMAAELKVDHEQRMAAIEEQAWRENMSEQQKNEMLFREDMRYMDEQRILYRQGTLERINLERDIEERQQQHRLQQEQYYEQQLEQAREQLLGVSNERQKELALQGLKEMYDALKASGVIQEQEYQEMLLAVKAQYANYQTRGERDQKAGTNALKIAQSNARQQLDQKATVPSASASGASLPIVGDIMLYQSTMEHLKQMYQNDEMTHAQYLAAKQQATAQFCESLASQMQAAYNTVNHVMSAASSYFSAQQEYETALVKAKYEKEIEAAGNNQAKVKKLQEKQQKEEAAIKTKYAKRAAAIQMAQAVAQTAISAINAYSSAAAIPVTGFVLAPIAAAAAIAAGMLQIAAIKKQQQAQQAGYYEGGFTGGHRYRKEAGVVHEGEFVANHRAVENPAILPFLNFLDQAQRNNTVGSLTVADVSRSLAPVSGASASGIIAPIVNVQTDNEELREAVTAHREATEKLLARLARPIIAQVVLTGPDGLNEQQEYLNQMLKNK